MHAEMTASDVAITDFRAEHDAALSSRAHPEHALRTQELTQLYERRYSGGGEEVAAPDGSTTEFRTTHEQALNDRSHPDHAIRTAELTKMHERDARAGNPANEDAAGEYDFSRFKATAQGPAGVELVQDAELERQAATWMREGGLSRSEGEAMASVYSESLRWTDADIASIGQVTESGLHHQFGDDAPEAAAAALRIADETGVREFLEHTGMINHWSVVSRLIDAATKRGYFKPNRG